MKIEQFVMAYGVEQDRLRAILPEGFESLRPVLRINSEIREGKTGYVEFNTAVAAAGIRGWLNIGTWENAYFEKNKNTVKFQMEELEISFTAVGVEGGCPAEQDNEGCFFIDKKTEQAELKPPEIITAKKEFCDCSFSWNFGQDGAEGRSLGKTLPAPLQEVKHVYPKQEFTVKQAAMIPCIRVLGSYAVMFER